MFKYCFILFFALSTVVCAQPSHYSSFNGHSHNDYHQLIPFYTAYTHRLGSIEADIILKNDTLFVGHEESELKPGRTLENLYLKPLQKYFDENGERAFKESDVSLQLLIDIKTDAYKTLAKLSQVLASYKNLVDTEKNHSAVKIVVSGNRPTSKEFIQYAPYIFFDGNAGREYSADELSRIALMSAPFTDYSAWNGKGRMVEKEENAVKNVIAKVHKVNKPIRFWASPDNKTAWLSLANLGTDYIGTDKPEELSKLLSSFKKDSYKAETTHSLYKAKYINDDKVSKVKNVILIIGDGFGLAHMQAGLTANGGQLNLLQIMNIGLSRTASSDNFHTDSAAGATAMATGNKTRNRYISMSTDNVKVENIPERLEKWKMNTGIISNGDLTDATPACFYAHNIDRENSDEIATGLLTSPVDFIAGDGIQHFNEKRADHHSLLPELKAKGFTIANTSDVLNVKDKRLLLFTGEGEIDHTRGAVQSASFLLKSTDLAFQTLASPNGFFLMIEEAQIDWGGHSNDLSHLTQEVLALDQVVGKAMEFADSNGETLVIITADHETGGLTLLDGSEGKRSIYGNFSTIDHTGIMVPVYAYGPHSNDFKGIYENNEIFHKIMKVLKKYK